MEKKLLVTTYKLVFICPKCNKGEMNTAGNGIGVPIKFPHACEHKKCGNSLLLDKQYPYIAFEPVPVNLGRVRRK